MDPVTKRRKLNDGTIALPPRVPIMFAGPIKPIDPVGPIDPAIAAAAMRNVWADLAGHLVVGGVL